MMPQERSRAETDRTGSLLLAVVTALLLMLSALHAQAADPLRVEGLRVVGDASRARIVIDVSASPDMRWFLVRAPHRLVLEFADVEYRHEDEPVKPRGLVSDIAFGPAGDGRSRLVLHRRGGLRRRECRDHEERGRGRAPTRHRSHRGFGSRVRGRR